MGGHQASDFDTLIFQPFRRCPHLFSLQAAVNSAGLLNSASPSISLNIKIAGVPGGLLVHLGQSGRFGPTAVEQCRQRRQLGCQGVLQRVRQRDPRHCGAAGSTSYPVQ
jgi:hypothetical protein